MNPQWQDASSSSVYAYTDVDPLQGVESKAATLARAVPKTPRSRSPEAGDAMSFSRPGIFSNGYEFTVTLQKQLSADRKVFVKLGLHLKTNFEYCLVVHKVDDDGAVGHWNKEHASCPHVQILEHDILVVVNGVAEQAEKMLEILKNETTLTLNVHRPSGTSSGEKLHWHYMHLSRSAHIDHDLADAMEVATY
jgi:hypothetical protein